MALTTMLPILAATSAVGTAGSIAANVLTNKANRNSQFDQNQALMNEQAKLNQQNWETQFSMTNAYNDPSAQLARLQGAGLNPLFNDNAGASSASPSVGSAGLPSVTAPQTMDYAGALNGVLQSIFSMFQLKNETAKTSSEVVKNEAEAEATNKDIVNKTNLTNSEVSVNQAKIDLMLKEGNLNDEQKNYVEQQTAANKEYVRQKWHELELMSQKVGAELRNVAVNEYNSKWQEQVGMLNAKSNYLQGQSSMIQAKNAQNLYNFGIKKWTQEFAIQVAKYSKELTNGNIDSFIKLLEVNKVKGIPMPHLLTKQSALCEAFVQNLNQLNVESFNKILPYFIDTMENLESVQFSPIQPPIKKSFNPAPWFNDEY